MKEINKKWTDFDSINSFEKFLRENCDITPKKYCEEILAKKDPISNSPIFFRSLEQYLLTDFENKSNMMKWIRDNESDAEKIRRYLRSRLERYCRIKKTEYLPSHFDLRTMRNMLSYKTYFKYFSKDDFISFAKQLGSLRYDYDFSGGIPSCGVEKIKKIVCDTREQKPINFSKNIDIEIKKLDFGDYWAGGDLFIERKSLNDLISTLSSGWTRFNNEMDRVKGSGKYCVIVVDCDINDFLGFKYMRECRHVKASEDFIYKRCRDLNRSFPENIQFLFSGGRKNSSKLIPLLFSLDSEFCRKTDLQFCKDLKYFDSFLK